MMLTPAEFERLTIFNAAEMARRNKTQGIKLSAPEAIAYICDALLLGARRGQSLKELMALGHTLLTTDDVMPGVDALIPIIQVEALFPDGTKMITVHDPILPGKERVERTEESRPGEVIHTEGIIEINAGRPRARLTVTNTGDRAVQVGSHYHFFEANKALDFDRAASFGMRLDAPSGTAVRFEPGEAKTVDLVAFGGARVLSGFNGLTNGPAESEAIKRRALDRARAAGFRGA